METPATSFMLSFFAYAAQRDIAPEQLCKLAHIDVSWLYLSPRTLQRRLKEEDLSFQQLADHARQHLAVQALRQERYTVKEIAYMMGYNELSAFSRAFKRWTGSSPENYRLNNSERQK